MIAVASHHVGQVALVPRIPVQVVVVFRLLLLPHVEGFVQHDEAHAIGEIEQLGGRRIVRRADRVDAHVAHDLELPLERARVHRRAEGAEVVVQAHAADLHGRAVEDEPAVGVEHERAHAERRVILVAGLPPTHHARHGPVQVRPLERPPQRVPDDQVLRHFAHGVAGHSCLSRGRPHFPAGGVVQYRAQDHRLIDRRGVAHGGADRHPGGGGRDLGRGDIGAPVVHVHRVGRDQADMPVDPGARVPARVGLLRVVHPHRDHVARRPVVEVGRQRVAERAVSVRPLPQVMPVDPHFAVAVHAIELDEHQPARVPRGQGEGLAVPAHAAGERSAARAGGIGVAELSLDAPVVRHSEVAPGGIVERRILSVRDVAQVESPGAVEREHCPLPLRYRRRVRGDD